MSAQSKVRAWPARDELGRTNQPVRRNSREQHAQERPEFLSHRQRGERLKAFRRHATAQREPGRRRGAGWRDGRLMRGELQQNPEAYSAAAGDVLEYLLGLAVSTGRVFPSYRKISAAAGCAYKTAVRCVQQLARGGWIAWERRFVRVAQGGALEPQVHQATNLYRLALPNAARQLIDAWAAKPKPRPADVPDEWAANYYSGETEGALARAVAEAERDAQRRNQHLLLKLAAARTIAEVEAALTGAQRTRDIFDKLERGLGRKAAGPPTDKRESPGGSEAPFRVS